MSKRTSLSPLLTGLSIMALTACGGGGGGGGSGSGGSGSGGGDDTGDGHGGVEIPSALDATGSEWEKIAPDNGRQIAASVLAGLEAFGLAMELDADALALVPAGGAASDEERLVDCASGSVRVVGKPVDQLAGGDSVALDFSECDAGAMKANGSLRIDMLEVAAPETDYRSESTYDHFDVERGLLLAVLHGKLERDVDDGSATFTRGPFALEDYSNNGSAAIGFGYADVDIRAVPEVATIADTRLTTSDWSGYVLVDTEGTEFGPESGELVIEGGEATSAVVTAEDCTDDSSYKISINGGVTSNCESLASWSPAK